jgi:hypothetical protein
MAPRKPRFWKSLYYRDGKIVSARDKSPWTVGEWREVPAPSQECVGLNCCVNIIDAMRYVDMEILAEVEIDGVRIDGDDKITAERMRVIRAWHWKREDTVLLVAYETRLYLEYLESLSKLEAVLSKKEIEAAKVLIENPTYENMMAAMAALFGGSWFLGALAGAFYWYLYNAASYVYRYVGARVAFSQKDRGVFFMKAHKWVVKHTAKLEAV